MAAQPNPEPDPAEPQVDAEKADDSPGVLASYGVVLLVFGAANVAVRFIDSARLQSLMYTAVFGAFLTVRWLRKAMINCLIGLAAVAVATYFISYRDEVRRGELTRVDAARAIVGKLSGYAAVKQVRLAFQESAKARNLLAHEKYLDPIDGRAPEINRLASELAHGCPAADRICETSRILRFVTDEIDYRNDPRSAGAIDGGDYVKPPLETLAAKAGDCEDKTILLLSLLGSVGHKTFMVFTSNHAYGLDCYEKSLDALLLDGVRKAGRESVAEYIGDVAGGRKPKELADAVRGADLIRIGSDFCYPLESTAKGSWIGVANEQHEYVTAFDTVTKQRVRFER